jgi:hypothetical protein
MLLSSKLDAWSYRSEQQSFSSGMIVIAKSIATQTSGAIVTKPQKLQQLWQGDR